MNRTFYDTFIAKAALGRKRSKDQIETVAQGRVWTGTEALAVGLVDRLGGLDEAVAVARKKARVTGDVSLTVFPARKGFFELLIERQDEDVVARVLGPRPTTLLRWMAALGDRGPIARLPFELQIR
jgi:protease-4